MVNYTILFFRYIWYILRYLWFLSTNNTESTNMIPRFKKIPMKFIIHLAGLMLVLLCVGAERVVAQTTTSDQEYNTGKNFFDMKDYQAAIRTWENLLTNHPNYAEKEKVWYSIARAAILQKTQSGNSTAINYLDKIISLKDTNSQYYEQSLFLIGETLFSYANQLSNSKDLVQAKTYAIGAKSHFDTLLTEFPDSPNKLQTLHYQTLIAVLYLQSAVETKKYSDLALKSSSPLDSQTNQDILNNCKFYYAWAIGQLGEEARARGFFEEFIQAKDTARGPKSLFELAHTYYRADEYQKALDELNRYTSVFPNDTSSETFLDVQRLKAMCYYYQEKYTDATNLIDQVIKKLPETAVPFQDCVFVSLCYMKTKNSENANQYIAYLEQEYANTPYTDALHFLRAVYYAEMEQHQNAINLIWPILGATHNSFSGTITFNKLPRNSETTDANKCGLSEEYYIKAASQLAISCAKLGNTQTARQVYNAMFQVSQQMYSRYSTIREKTLNQINEIERSLQSGTLTPPSITTPHTVTPPPNPGSVSSNFVTSPPGSIIQLGESNSLATRPMTPSEQNIQINQLQTRADNAKRDRDMGYIDGVLKELEQLMQNRNLSEYSTARVAILLGELKYFAKGDRDIAIQMAELAYEYIVNDHTENNRNTETFVRAAKGLGRYAAFNGNYTMAAKYFEEALVTTVGNEKIHRAELRYRYGAALLKFPNRREEALGYFTAVYMEDKASDYWSHAALQLAIAYYQDADFSLCEKTIDELIEVMPDKAILDRVLFLKGELALQNKQWDIAADSFDAVRKYAPTSSLANSAAMKWRDARDPRRQMTQ